jgi:hypothetical protein
MENDGFLQGNATRLISGLLRIAQNITEFLIRRSSIPSLLPQIRRKKT